MADVQVSNARRVGFTALALVSLWTLVFAAERFGYRIWRDLADDAATSTGWRMDTTAITSSSLLASVLSLTVLPSMFVLVSCHVSLVGLRDKLVWGSSALFAVTLWVGYRLGMHNAYPCSDWNEWISLVWSKDIDIALAEQLACIRDERHVSTLWLLLPLFLTTVFVIFGAWRRAVRDAAVGEVVDDE